MSFVSYQISIHHQHQSTDTNNLSYTITMPPTPFLPSRKTDLVNDELVGVGEALFRLSPELFLVLGESRPQSPQRVRRSNQHRVADLPFQNIPTVSTVSFRRHFPVRFQSFYVIRFASNRFQTGSFASCFVEARGTRPCHKYIQKSMPLYARYSIPCSP